MLFTKWGKRNHQWNLGERKKIGRLKIVFNWLLKPFPPGIIICKLGGKMRIPFYQVDAFTDKVFGGNQAAVCPLESWLDTALMQNIAAENNLSETAFYVKKGNQFEIRWFTPKLEIDLAGHPTLATAHVIFNHTDYNKDKITFLSTSGELVVTKSDNLLQMNFPARPPEAVDAPEELVKGLGLEPLEVLKSRDYLALYPSEKDIRSIKPKFDVLAEVDCLGMIITAKGDQSDFVSRFFAPRAGINEDPVTGSAHSTLIPFWAKKLDKKDLHAFQLSERKGELFCEYLGDRVIIGGYAVTCIKGEFFL
jgi:PhzF family phenazine biosynthesis protein